MKITISLLLLFIVLQSLTACNSKPKRKIKIGDPAPLFKGQALNGESFNMVDFSGQPVIIRFWSTECQYCRADTPVFNEFYDRYKDKGLKIAYINTLSNLTEVQAFIQELQITFPVLMDKGGIIAQDYAIKVVPQTIVINRKGIISAAILGGVSKPELLELLGEDLR